MSPETSMCAYVGLSDAAKIKRPKRFTKSSVIRFDCDVHCKNLEPIEKYFLDLRNIFLNQDNIRKVFLSPACEWPGG